MRRSSVLLLLLVAQPTLQAQDDVVRGCVTQMPQGVALKPLNPSGLAVDTSNLVNGGRWFLLFADDDLLDEIASREGNQIEVTGHINPAVPGPIVERGFLKPPGGGNVPGLGGQDPLNPPGRVSERGPSRSPRADQSQRAVTQDVIAVTEYKSGFPFCLPRMAHLYTRGAPSA